MAKSYKQVLVLDKIFFVCFGIILVILYAYGTFNPNEYAEKKIFKIAENDYLVKVKEWN